MPLAAPQDVIRCFVTHRVWAEVPRVLQQRHAKPDSRPFDLRAAERLRWEQYLPAVQVVTVEGMAPVTDHARALLNRDPTDSATAILADL